MPKRLEHNVYCMDAFNLLRRLSKCIDLIVTSPPYNTSRVGATDKFNSRYDPKTFKDFKTDKDYIDWTVNLFNAYDRALVSNGVICYNLSYSSEKTYLIWLVVSAIIERTCFTTADTIVWKKKSAIPNNRSSNKLTRICEFVFVFVRKSEINTFHCNKSVVSVSTRGQNNYENRFNFIEAKNNDFSSDLNKATFSTDFARELIKLYGKQYGTCLDSFTGLGATMRASALENMSFIGSELSEEQVNFTIEKQKTLYNA